MTGRVLVAEDRPAQRAALAAALGAGFFDCTLLAGPERLRARARAEAPDAIVLRGDLPGAGLDRESGPAGFSAAARALCLALRADPATARVPLLVTLPASAFQAIPAVLEAGADEALLRPVADAVLVARLRGLVRHKLMLDEMTLREALAREGGRPGAGDPFAPPPGLIPGPESGPISGPVSGPVSGMAEAPAIWGEAAAPAAPRIALLSPQGAPDGLRAALARHLGGPAPSRGTAQAQALLFDLRSLPEPEAERALHRMRAGQSGAPLPWVVLLPPGAAGLRAQLLDRGASDCLCALPEAGGDDALARETALRLAAVVARARQADLARAALARSFGPPVTDPLTGLFNRTYAEGALARLAGRARLSGRPLACLHISLEGGGGAPLPPAALRAAASRLRGELRGGDLPARAGAAALVALLPDTDAARAGQVAGRVARALAAALPGEEGGSAPDGLPRVGLAIWHEEAPFAPSRLLQEAEAQVAVGQGGDGQGGADEAAAGQGIAGQGAGAPPQASARRGAPSAA